MKFLHIVIFCCFSVVYLKESEVLELSGHVGGEVSVRCSGSWTTDNSSQNRNMYFCKGVCSRESVLIQTERRRPTVTQGRYRLEVSRGYGVFYVTIKRLRRADAGEYCCGVEKAFKALHQNINLKVLNAFTVPAGSLPFTTTTLQTGAEALSQGSFLSSTEPAALTLPPTEKTKQQAANSLTDTTVVIIVSVSLALLVCAVIPLIFYGHWRSNAEGQSSQEENKGETAVRLQSLEPDADPESSAQDAPQYAAAYQALDPKTLD